jgi:diphosphomevalonate decarboxylase
MGALKATAAAGPNIAFVKYWGDVDPTLHLPANPSTSLTLDGLSTVCTVEFAQRLKTDRVTIDGMPAAQPALRRVTEHLDRVRALAETHLRARVVSQSDFPSGAGLASSASAFAALTLAAATALQLQLHRRDLSSLARLGSGSACRSVPGGFVEWQPGHDHSSSYARSIAPPSHWRLADCIALVSKARKPVSSSEGHARAPYSPLFRARVKAASRLVEQCRTAIAERDLTSLGRAMEADAVMLHAVAMTSEPPIHYWVPETVRVIRAVLDWRAQGLQTYFTIDAGPNVHCFCEERDSAELSRRLLALEGVAEVCTARPGDGACLVEEALI